MSNAFKDKLKQIRDASAKRSEIHLRVRSDEDMAKSQKTVQAFEFREALETVISDFFKNFQAEAPGFVLTRGFYEGKYMLSMRCEEELTDTSGHTSKYFSRLIFLLDPHVDDRSFSIQAKKTIRNRDLESVSLNGAMGDGDQAAFASFVEAQFLEFAENYFGEHSLTRPTGVAT